MSLSGTILWQSSTKTLSVGMFVRKSVVAAASTRLSVSILMPVLQRACEASVGFCVQCHVCRALVSSGICQLLTCCYVGVGVLLSISSCHAQLCDAFWGNGLWMGQLISGC